MTFKTKSFYKKIQLKSQFVLTCISTILCLTFIPLILNLRSLIYLPNQWACTNQISFPSKQLSTRELLTSFWIYLCAKHEKQKAHMLLHFQSVNVNTLEYT